MGRTLRSARERLVSMICSPKFYFGMLFVVLFHVVFSLNSTSENRREEPPMCQWKFDRYVSSEWEKFWFDGISQLQENVCPTLQRPDQSVKSVRALEKILQFRTKISERRNFSSDELQLFSQMIYRYDCSTVERRAQATAVQLIEPLIGLLRDPLTMCSYENLPEHLALSGDEAVQSKRFFLLGSSAPFQTGRAHDDEQLVPWLRAPGSQLILFDLGSSLFNGLTEENPHASWTAARWFYESFKSISMQFDRIIAFEYQNYTPDVYWKQIPEDLLGRLTFINVGVQANGRYNPWRILQSIAKPDDYVLVKLDIDTPNIEMSLLDQALKDPAISSLIDEMFFEMHVTVKEMFLWWQTPGGTLQDSYVLFRRLRQLGIRMHSWP